MDKEAAEKFHDYRITRCDVSLNAIQMAPVETIRVLSTNLHSALDAYNPERFIKIFLNKLFNYYFLEVRQQFT